MRQKSRSEFHPRQKSKSESNQRQEIFKDIVVKTDKNLAYKTPYWYHGSAKLLKEKWQKIQQKFVLKINSENTNKTYVHVRATDKQANNNWNLYSQLIKIAQANHGKIYLVGDNKDLLEQLNGMDQNIIYEMTTRKRCFFLAQELL